MRRLRFHWRSQLTLVLAVCGLLLTPSTGPAQQCDDLDDCTLQDTCQTDGTCKGTPLPDGTACGRPNPCGTFACQHGRCIPATYQHNGEPCDDGNPCTLDDRCYAGFCYGGFKDCPNVDGNPCTVNYCDPATGQCTSVSNSCEDQCTTGTCDRATGNCVNLKLKADDTACDDGRECTVNDHCHSGVCRGQAVSEITPTASAAPVVPTATPTLVPGRCAGDCGGNGQVSVDELVTMVNIALGVRPLADCVAGDANGDGRITIDEIIAAVNNALNNNCPLSQ